MQTEEPLLKFDPRFADPAPRDPNAPMTEAEFCQRFKARMLDRAGPIFDDETSVAEYADMTGPSYFEDVDMRDHGPEECADTDMSYWEE